MLPTAFHSYGLLGDDLSETDCMRAFGWSRAISSDPYRLSARGGKEVLLSFECFLELVRSPLISPYHLSIARLINS